MKDTFFLTFNRNGVVSMNKRDKPKLSSGEKFAIVTVEVADSIFQPPAVPRVEIKVENPVEVHLPEVTVSEVQADVKGLNETWKAQQKVNAAAAKLLETGLQCGDEEMVRTSVGILAALQEAGIKIEINLPEDKTE